MDVSDPWCLVSVVSFSVDSNARILDRKFLRTQEKKSEITKDM